MSANSLLCCVLYSWLYDPRLLEYVPVAFHCKLHLGRLLVNVFEKMLLGWNVVPCLLDMHNMRLLKK